MIPPLVNLSIVFAPASFTAACFEFFPAGKGQDKVLLHLLQFGGESDNLGRQLFIEGCS